MSEIVEVLPHEKHWVRDAVLQKKALTVHGIKWVDRKIVLLEDKLTMCRLGSDRISECIPLSEMLSVQIIGNSVPGAVDDFRQQSRTKNLRALVKEEFGRLKGTDDDSSSDVGLHNKRIEKFQP
eukprot:3819576-Rhodomonas_salina.1